MEAIIQFKNLADIDKKLVDDKTCRAYYEQIRWDGCPTCPHCGSDKYYVLKPSAKQNEYKCGNKECHKKFNCLTGTVFQGTQLSLIIWFKAIHLVTTLSKGISSPNIADMLGCTQKTGWFLEHRIREMLTEKAPILLEGEVETDETLIGGLEHNKHLNKRNPDAGPVGKKAQVLGIVQRGGHIYCLPVPDRKGKTILPIMRAVVKPNSTIYSDEHTPYKRLKDKYTHESVNHRAGEYVRGLAHTGTVDSSWNLLKKKINCIHHFVSHKHLHRYCNEFAFSRNYRGLKQYERFNVALSNCEGRLKYHELIAPVG